MSDAPLPMALDAEGSVLCAIFDDPDGLVLDQVRSILEGPTDFYSRANAFIYETICTLANEGQKPSPVSVAQRLNDTDRLKDVGGVKYIYETIALTIPAVVHVEQHARVVLEKSRLRRMIATCKSLAAQAYGESGDSVQSFIEGAELSIGEIAHAGDVSRLKPISKILQDVHAATNAASKVGSEIIGKATGFVDLDKLTSGLHDGDLRIVAGRPAMGKAQPLEAKVLTPNGWRLMGNLRVGDLVIGGDGLPKKVVAVHERGRLDVWRVTMGDGASTECCNDHLWLTKTRNEQRYDRPATVRRLEEVRETVVVSDGYANHCIPSFGTPQSFKRYIQSVQPIGQKICRCITIDADDGLYVTDGYIVTHNSSYALCEALGVARTGYAVPFFSLEMPELQLVYRLVSLETGIPINNLRTGNLTTEQWTDFNNGIAVLSKMPIWIDDSASLSPAQLRSRTRRLMLEINKGQHPHVTTGKVGVIYVDYLQLMTSPLAGQRFANREVEVSAISRELKNIAKVLMVPLTAMSQLNRGVESRADKRPLLSDLRESGAIEQDADTVIFMYRPEYYLGAETPDDDKGICELIVAKQRNGATDTVKLKFDGPTTCFTNYAGPGYNNDEFDNFSEQG